MRQKREFQMFYRIARPVTLDHMHMTLEAERRVAAMVNTMGAVRPDLVPLSQYADAETFNLLLGDKAGWTFEDWQAVNMEVARQLRARGYHVQMVRLEAMEFLDWCIRYKLPNTPANRAQFVSWKLCPPDAKPEPIR
jgi:hypothetical protein